MRRLKINLTDIDGFDLVDSATFDGTNVVGEKSVVTDGKYNYCPECNTPMKLAGSTYKCAECGLTRTGEVEIHRDTDNIISSTLRIHTGHNKGKHYNLTCDYSKIQYKTVLDQLLRRQNGYKGPAIPANVLCTTAEQYNKIQKMIKEDEYDENGNVTGQKRFVRRGSIKDEVLAYLIYCICIREGVVRKKKDIATFMGLQTSGFAKGENIVRDLEAKWGLGIVVEDDPVCGYIDKYLEVLDMESANNKDFIIDIVVASEKERLGMNSQISSKVVGTIWLLITRCGLSITAHKLEMATDTKKNTFMKFYSVIIKNIVTFARIFEKYGVPLLPPPRK